MTFCTTKTIEFSGCKGRIAATANDPKDMAKIKHSIWDMIHQRVYALAPGYEDLNDPVYGDQLGRLLETKHY